MTNSIVACSCFIHCSRQLLKVHSLEISRDIFGQPRPCGKHGPIQRHLLGCVRVRAVNMVPSSVICWDVSASVR
ncbi:hypothetical protein PoB_000367900 [Plakobranchus ocellatus]|uniref:Uncharacterized protein n=1 Tax=Plakobranchus ocellatus TaxID=259542 RepID=A0AAV3Y2I4_9GAST|nr:hypothetical protein PoB_000367900 [Plakobranchus ocellatus]